jgi:hypothetical protein
VIIAEALSDAYGNVSAVDLYIGGLAEDHVNKSNLGETFHKIVSAQCRKTDFCHSFFNTDAHFRDGDRFWYDQANMFTESERQEIKKIRLSHLILRNTMIPSIQCDVFTFGDKSVSTKSLCLSSNFVRFVNWQVMAQYSKSGQTVLYLVWTLLGHSCPLP